MGYYLGVDIGTTYTAAAVWRDGRCDVANLGNRAPSIPSVVFLRDDGTVLVGEAAVRRASTEPSGVAREFKRRVGDPTPVIVGGTPYSADALIARLLRAVVDLVVATEGAMPERIAITHPANWGPYKLDLLRQATRLADLDDVVTVSEPEAAAIHYASQSRVEVGSVIAVYDLGGGTFDAAVLRKTGPGWEVLGTPEGIERLGGVDFDAAVHHHVSMSIGDALDALSPDDTAAMAAAARLRQECVDAKEALSSDSDVSIPVLLPSVQTEVRLTRAEYEQMVRPALADTITSLNRALRSAKVEPSDVTTVLLVGGSSRTPLVAELVSSTLGRPVAVDAHPKYGVALGAAITAAMSGGRLSAADNTSVALPPGLDDAAPSAGAGGPADGRGAIAGAAAAGAAAGVVAGAAGAALSGGAASAERPAGVVDVRDSQRVPAPSATPASSPSPSADPRRTPAPAAAPAARARPADAEAAPTRYDIPGRPAPGSDDTPGPTAPVSRPGPSSPYSPASQSVFAGPPGSSRTAPGSSRVSGEVPAARGSDATGAAGDGRTDTRSIRVPYVGGEGSPPSSGGGPRTGEVPRHGGGNVSSGSRWLIPVLVVFALVLAAGVGFLALSRDDDPSGGSDEATVDPDTAAGATGEAPGTTTSTAPPAPTGEFVQLSMAIVEDGQLRVEYEVSNFEPSFDGLHVHLFLDPSQRDNAGENGAPVEKYAATDQPSGVVTDEFTPDELEAASQVCALVAEQHHGVIHQGEDPTGNCVPLIG